MINDIFNFLNQALSGKYYLAIGAAFGWGILSIALSPCHLSSIPLVIGFINTRHSLSVKKTFIISILFSSGILVSIALIGLITAYAGRMIGNIGSAGNYLVSAVFFISGLYLINIIKLPARWINTQSSPSHSEGNELLQALTLGLVFGIGLGPCTFAFMAPVLGVVFSAASTKLLHAAVLLLSFAAGHCMVIVLAGILTSKVQMFLNWTEESKAVTYIKRTCGALVISAGAYLIYTA